MGSGVGRDGARSLSGSRARAGDRRDRGFAFNAHSSGRRQSISLLSLPSLSMTFLRKPYDLRCISLRKIKNTLESYHLPPMCSRRSGESRCTHFSNDPFYLRQIPGFSRVEKRFGGHRSFGDVDLRIRSGLQQPVDQLDESGNDSGRLLPGDVRKLAPEFLHRVD